MPSTAPRPPTCPGWKTGQVPSPAAGCRQAHGPHAHRTLEVTQVPLKESCHVSKCGRRRGGGGARAGPLRPCRCSDGCCWPSKQLVLRREAVHPPTSVLNLRGLPHREPPPGNTAGQGRPPRSMPRLAGLQREQPGDIPGSRTPRPLHWLQSPRAPRTACWSCRSGLVPRWTCLPRPPPVPKRSSSCSQS